MTGAGFPVTLPDKSPCSAINKAVPEEPTATAHKVPGWVGAAERDCAGTPRPLALNGSGGTSYSGQSVTEPRVLPSRPPSVRPAWRPRAHTLINVPELHFSSQPGHVEGEAAGNSDKFKGLNGDSFTMPEWPPWLHSCQILLARPRPCVSIGSWPIPSSYRGTSRK